MRTPSTLEANAQVHVGIVRRVRCGVAHPSHPTQVKCDLDYGHVDWNHSNGFYMRLWSDEDIAAAAGPAIPDSDWD